MHLTLWRASFSCFRDRRLTKERQRQNIKARKPTVPEWDSDEGDTGCSWVTTLKIKSDDSSKKNCVLVWFIPKLEGFFFAHVLSSIIILWCLHVPQVSPVHLKERWGNGLCLKQGGERDGRGGSFLRVGVFDFLMKSFMLPTKWGFVTSFKAVNKHRVLMATPGVKVKLMSSEAKGIHLHFDSPESPSWLFPDIQE